MTNSIERTSIVAESVTGLGMSRHAWVIYGLIRSLQPDIIVEIGAWKGFTTLHMAQACEDNQRGQVVVIDDYSLGSDMSDIANAMRYCGLANRVSYINGKSQDVAWPSRVDFAFIDGDHSFEGCLNDANKAIERGAKCLVLHDTSGWWGPSDFLDIFRKEAEGQWDVLEFYHDSGLAVLLKREAKGEPEYTKEKYPLGCI